MATVFAYPFGFQVIDNNGLPVPGALINSYIAGQTGPEYVQATYVDGAGTTENANPIVADGYGRFSAFLDVTLSYHFVVTNPDATITYLDEDNVTQNTNNSINANNVLITLDTTNQNDYLLLTNSENTGTYHPPLFNSTFYVNPSNGTLYATTFSGAVSGNATTATTATNIAGGANGDLVIQTGSGATGFLAPGTSGYYLTSQGSGNQPVWTTPPAISSVYGCWRNCATLSSSGVVDYQTAVTSSGVTRTSAGHYTVSTTGDYEVIATVSVSQYGGSAPAQMFLYHNGSSTGINNYGYLYNNDASGYPTITVNGIISCNGSDTFEIYLNMPTDSNTVGGTGAITIKKIS